MQVQAWWLLQKMHQEVRPCLVVQQHSQLLPMLLVLVLALVLVLVLVLPVGACCLLRFLLGVLRCCPSLWLARGHCASSWHLLRWVLVFVCVGVPKHVMEVDPWFLSM